MPGDRIPAVTQQAVDNLKQEGYDAIDCQIEMSGDVMQDAAMYYAKSAGKKANWTTGQPGNMELVLLLVVERLLLYSRMIPNRIV